MHHSNTWSTNDGNSHMACILAVHEINHYLAVRLSPREWDSKLCQTYEHNTHFQLWFVQYSRILRVHSVFGAPGVCRQERLDAVLPHLRRQQRGGVLCQAGLHEGTHLRPRTSEPSIIV